MKKATLDKLTQRQLQLVLTYAPAGLGHLRITDALYHGLPEVVNPVVLGSQDKSIQTIHRITSIHPIARSIFEWLQSGPLSSPANRLYRYSLRWNTGLVYQEMSRLMDERLEPPKKILVVSTHFGLAHKLAVIKEKFEKEKRVRMVLVVFVSDDTFQHIWYVDGANLLVVASQFIKKKYAAFGKQLGRSVRIAVADYPLNPNFEKKLDSRLMSRKINQLNPKSRETIQVSIPISGAAVGTDYFSKLIAGLRARSGRFRFFVVSKDAPFTRSFLTRLHGQQGVNLRIGRQDREVVDLYDNLMDQQIISLEVTKPSEQAFKALLGTQSRGGVILLFSEPVGRQEFDNLDFLERHSLVPTKQANAELWEMSENTTQGKLKIQDKLFAESRSWRGVRLPKDPQKSADFIWWLLTSGILSRMLASNKVLKVRDGGPETLGSNGVGEFWDLATSI